MSEECIFTGFRISATGLSAQRKKMDVIANNMANAGTTRTVEGGPYKRKFITFMPKINPKTGVQEGVEVKGISVDPAAPRMIYDPTHPDADKKGYVAYPNVNTITEMVDMLQVVRAYEANVTALNAAKEIINKSLDIVR
ncbi:MAG: flagellar basal body rod protein FlgC [Candidatus Omnitrophota bacterium]|nr:MAG: flagellar basal body rod protein FlgC [Candidatus Omnitrophota bacterium]